jgi:hypothetical protein
MHRRGFLRAAVAAGVGGAALAARPRAARAQPFGDAPGDAQAAKLLGVGQRAESVLEVYLYGGLSFWETFYCVAAFGRPDAADPARQNTQFYRFFGTKSQATAEALGACGRPGPFSMDTMLTPFARDAAGVDVSLGPYAAPLLARPDVTARMRVVVNRHELEPHEAAIPMALCGRRLGSPNMASLGAHAQRYFVEHAPRTSPYSYIFGASSLPIENVRAAVATGTHPGASRPLLIKVDAAARLATLLGRPAFAAAGSRERHDALVQAYGEQLRGRMSFGGETGRAPRLRELEQAQVAVEGAGELQALLDPSLFASVPGEACGSGPRTNVPAMSLRLATYLLTHPTAPARYCCFIDPGLVSADAGGGYDTHLEAPLTQARNIGNTLTELLASINEPGEKDPRKIDLDRTMIVLNTEFGRSPTSQGDLGRNHWPYGYAQVYLGGPIGPGQRAIEGAIGEDGHATSFTTPSENRIACLLALGIWPFSPDSYGTSDVQDAQGEIDAIERVSARVLGRAV